MELTYYPYILLTIDIVWAFLLVVMVIGFLYIIYMTYVNKRMASKFDPNSQNKEKDLAYDMLRESYDRKFKAVEIPNTALDVMMFEESEPLSINQTPYKVWKEDDKIVFLPVKPSNPLTSVAYKFLEKVEMEIKDIVKMDLLDTSDMLVLNIHTTLMDRIYRLGLIVSSPKDDIVTTFDAWVPGKLAHVQSQDASTAKARLESLKTLKDDALITEEEYEAKRKKILDDM